MASTTRKTTAARPAANRSRTAKKATPPAKKAATAAKVETPKVKKSDIEEHLRDYTYLAEKAPTDLHQDFAAWMIEVIGLEFDEEQQEAFLKGVQVAAVLRGVYQRSPRNKARTGYRGLDEVVVEQRSVHMIAAHQEANKLREATQPAKKAPAKRTARKAVAK